MSFLHFQRLYPALLALMPVLAAFVPRFMGPGAVLIAVLCLAVYYAEHKKWPAFSRPVFYWVMAVAGLAALSILWSVDPPFVAKKVFTTLPVLFSFAALAGLSAALDETGRSNFLRWFPVSVLVASLVCAADLYSGGIIYRLAHEQKRALFNGSVLNRGIIVLLLAGIISLHALRITGDKDNRTKILAAGLVAALLLIAAKTESQSMQLALIVAALAGFLFPYRFRAAYISLGALITGLVFAAPWIAQFLFSLLARNLHDSRLFWSAFPAPRLEIWDFISRRALERPFTGFGFEATRLIKDFDSGKLFFSLTTVLHPHNFALQLWIEFGVWGPLLGACLFAYILRKIWKSGRAHARFLLPLFIAILSMAATSYGLWQNWWLGTFALTLAWSTVIAKTPASNKDLPSA
ncbi:MAG: O-antigen ligase family protein [Alphaproteobacteria bacterium]|nr:O-antigen ligase family protein [Alphaproteobacteria bacterium]